MKNIFYISFALLMFATPNVVMAQSQDGGTELSEEEHRALVTSICEHSTSDLDKDEFADEISDEAYTAISDDRLEELAALAIAVQENSANIQCEN